MDLRESLCFHDKKKKTDNEHSLVFSSLSTYRYLAEQRSRTGSIDRNTLLLLLLLFLFVHQRGEEREVAWSPRRRRRRRRDVGAVRRRVESAAPGRRSTRWQASVPTFLGFRAVPRIPVVSFDVVIPVLFTRLHASSRHNDELGDFSRNANRCLHLVVGLIVRHRRRPAAHPSRAFMETSSSD